MQVQVQTTLSCIGKRAVVVNVKEKGAINASGEYQRDEYSEPLLMCRKEGTLTAKTGGIRDFREKSKRDLLTAWMASGI